MEYNRIQERYILKKGTDLYDSTDDYVSWTKCEKGQNFLLLNSTIKRCLRTLLPIFRALEFSAFLAVKLEEKKITTAVLQINIKF